MSRRIIIIAKSFWYFYMPLFVWMSVIFILSSQPAFGTSGQISLTQLLLRKGAHIVEYFVLGSLSFRIFRLYFSGSHAIAAGTVLFSLFYALSDEAHQLFVMGRHGRISDVGIDSLGILLSLVFFLVILPRWKTHSLERNRA